MFARNQENGNEMKLIKFFSGKIQWTELSLNYKKWQCFIAFLSVQAKKPVYFFAFLTLFANNFSLRLLLNETKNTLFSFCFRFLISLQIFSLSFCFKFAISWSQFMKETCTYCSNCFLFYIQLSIVTDRLIDRRLSSYACTEGKVNKIKTHSLIPTHLYNEILVELAQSISVVECVLPHGVGSGSMKLDRTASTSTGPSYGKEKGNRDMLGT